MKRYPAFQTLQPIIQFKDKVRDLEQICTAINDGSDNLLFCLHLKKNQKTFFRVSPQIYSELKKLKAKFKSFPKRYLSRHCFNQAY